jgi:protein gp37
VSAITKIQWTDRTWNPVRGCSRVSPGCDRCYAMGQAHRFAGPGKPYDGLTTIRRGKVDWTGVARLIPTELDAPLRWRKPQRIFVNSMSDLFHHSLSDEDIASVFAVMAAAPQHTFQVLTKRPERATELFSKMRTERSVRFGRHAGEPLPDCGWLYERTWQLQLRYRPGHVHSWSWPLPNVWLGVSIENQETADERIPLLMKIPSAVRFISAEPLLGPLDLRRSVFNRAAAVRAAMFGPAALNSEQADAAIGYPLDWVIAGGESGPGARECRQSWLERIVTDCREASVPVFVKQMGAAACDDVTWRGSQPDFHFNDRKGGDPAEWPAALQVREFPHA